MKRGFTLVELLIVIAIMGILTSITVSQFITAKKKANDVARKSDLNGISKALQMYFTDYGKMPAMSVDGKGKIMINSNTLNWGDEFKDGDYVYMIKLPKENNSAMAPYCYKTDSEKKKYALFAQLENTGDKECVGKYKCGNDIVGIYCFSYVSPNTSLDVNGNLL
jgi:type II secretion system protein G